MCTRHVRLLAAAVLLLAAFNLTFRINDTAITEWDESLYGLSAAEMLESGDWVATRFNGELDYTITKPPLIIWLVAGSFQLLGFSPVALRLTSVASAWLTVLVLILWAKRTIGSASALAAGLVLATSFGFMFVHSGRTGNTDALFTLLTTLAAVTVHASFTRPWWRAALGPIFAALFLLRGPGMLLPCIMVVLVEVWRGSAPKRWATTATAAALFAVPVGWWGVARWHIDEWRFLSQLWSVDLVTRTVTAFEEHTGSPLYYLDILQRYHYEWLIAATAALLLFPPSRARWAGWLRVRVSDPTVKIVVTCWAFVTFMVPTVMQTKLSWYLNPFYPVFALLVGALLARALIDATTSTRARRVALTCVIVIAVGAAEGRMLYQVYRRDKDHFLQGMLERERERLRGRTIYRAHWNGAERFVATRLVGSRVAYADGTHRFLDIAEVNDFLVGPPTLSDPRLEKVDEALGEALYRKAR